MSKEEITLEMEVPKIHEKGMDPIHVDMKTGGDAKNLIYDSIQ